MLFDTSVFADVRKRTAVNEGTTRLRLIDPVLFELGWKHEEIVAEWRNGDGAADYALISDEADIPSCIVEAKKLGMSLDDAIDQGIGYCYRTGIKYFAITDGNEWRVYETNKPVALLDKMIARCVIRSDSDAECLSALFILWREAIAGAIMPVKPPTTQVKPETGFAEPTGKQNIVGTPLTAIHYQDGMKCKGWLTRNGERKTKVDSWVGLLVAVMNEVNPQKPIKRGVRWLVNHTPQHDNGKKFFAQKRLSNGMWLETGSKGPRYILEICNGFPVAKELGLELH
jgi:hypothetical protein